MTTYTYHVKTTGIAGIDRIAIKATSQEDAEARISYATINGEHFVELHLEHIEE